MALSFEAFQRKVRRNFLENKDKKGLLGNIFSQLRRWLGYPTEYIQWFLDTLSGPMPLHAAVSAGYLQQHNWEEMPVYMAELKERCERDLIQELASTEPCIERCADLHTAFCYLTPDNTGTSIPEAVEMLSMEQRVILFQEVGRCIRAVTRVTKEEQTLLDPILTYFSQHYPEEINGSFLKQNQDIFSDPELFPKVETLSALLRNAIERKYFSYFRVLYTMFPNWHMNQREITAADMLQLGFQYADSPAHLLDVIYVALELEKEGHSFYETAKIQEWYQQIMSENTEFPVMQAVSYLYYAHRIETDHGQLAEIVHEMPFYQPDELFSEILPSRMTPVGGTFLQENVKTILKHDSPLLREYLDKLGKNNIYQFDTDADCPEAEPDNTDYIDMIRNIAWWHSAEEILFFYFNTHLRKMVPLWELKNVMYGKMMSIDFNEALQRYIFTATLYSKQENIYPVLATSQFNSTFPVDVCIMDVRHSGDGTWSSFLYFDDAFPDGRRMHIRLEDTEIWGDMDRKCYCVKGEILLSEKDKQYLKEIEPQRKQHAQEMLSSVLCEIIRTGKCTDVQRDDISRAADKITINDMQLSLYVDALEAVAHDQEQMDVVLSRFEELVISSDAKMQRDKIWRLWNLIKFGTAELHLDLLFKPPFNQAIDIIEMIDILPRKLKRHNMIDLSGTSLNHFKIAGKLHLNESGKIEFIPKNAICENAKMIVLNKTTDYFEGMEGSACIESYDITKNYFLCQFISVSEQMRQEQEWNSKRETSSELRSLLQKACTDDTVITNPPQEIFSEYDRDCPSEWLYEMIANRLRTGKIESINYYLNAIYHGTLLVTSLVMKQMCVSDSPKGKNLQDLGYKVIAQCPPKLIARIYWETAFHNDVPLNLWLSMSNRAGKLTHVIQYLQDFEIQGYSSTVMLKGTERERHTEPMQNVLLGRFSVDGMTGENFLVLETKEQWPPELKKFRLIGYDPDTDTVLLTKIIEK